MRYPLFVACVLLAGCSGKSGDYPAGTGEPPSGTLKEQEELVKRYVENNNKDVKFLKVGPNMGKAELDALWDEAGFRNVPFSEDPDVKEWLKFDALVRVRFSVKKVVQVQTPERTKVVEGTGDTVYLVAGKFVRAFRAGGDDWKKKFRADLSKTAPGVKP